ncbi:hypothetical protein PORY_001730 [Pneumocystis oryctolagi]|uniref:Uncharacterized protein n=1 Tax=Pneumocystis oryctolagi TaxID=42067 RepID=A0ACB7CCD1_9ASCO|nr:hypothetical protein PORY_001730 [Pneumocystis oryctolagi]
MGKQKNKESDKKTNKSRISGSLHIKGVNFYHDAQKVKRIKLLKSGKPIRNKDGKIIKHADFQSPDIPNARVQPDRRWFNSTRVISQNALDLFRQSFSQKLNDPYQFILKRNKLPISLLSESAKTSKTHIIDIEPFGDTFGPKAKRKRSKISAVSIEDLAESASQSYEKFTEKDLSEFKVDYAQEPPDSVFSKGKSKRIWNELYKVIDSSDVIIQLLDSRNPLGTRCKHVEQYLRKEKPHKHMILLLNKCDLIPTWCTRQWIKQLSKEYPTLAFHASINNPFGKGSLIQLLRQFSVLHSDKRQISVGFIGYPNTGKSSVINTLKSKKVCNVAPIPGETKVWQYIRMTSKIFMIDCPGIVPPDDSSDETEIIMKGAFRVEKISNPEQHIHAILNLCKVKHLERTYEISGWEDDPAKFLKLLAQKKGKLLKGGEPDESSVAKMVINDFIRGKIPWFIPPNEEDKSPIVESSVEKIV